MVMTAGLVRHLRFAVCWPMNKRIRFIAATAASALLGVCALSPVAGAASEISGKAFVRDADTIVVAGTPVRLNGLDAPENATRFGREATNYTKRLLTGRTVACRLNGDRTHDRWVGTCFISLEGEWVDIAAILVSNGYALDCRRYSGGRYRSLEPAGARRRLPQSGYC